MNCKALLAVAIALVALQLASGHPVKRSCACTLRGSDVCGGCVPAPAVRPVRPRAPQQGYQRVVYQKFAAPEFKPKNVCTCEGGLVTAPEVPRVPCKVHSGPVYEAPNYARQGAFGSVAGLFGGEAGDCGDAPAANPCEEASYSPVAVRTYTINAENNLPAEEMEEVPVPNSQPVQAADAVSLALAYQMATKAQKNILEENLAFGPMQTVKEGRIVQKKKYVPEAGLYAVRNQVVELKAAPSFGSSCDDEADAALLAAAQQSCGETEETGYGAPLPSYRDLGFSPVAGECNFVPGQYQPAPQAVQTVEYTVPGPAKAAPAPAYSSCNVLGDLERGRGATGPDYYGADAPAQEDLAESDSYSSCADAGSSYSVDVPRVASPVHTGRPGCSCGCRF